MYRNNPKRLLTAWERKLPTVLIQSERPLPEQQSANEAQNSEEQQPPSKTDSPGSFGINLVLIGFKSCGKTYFAERIGAPWIDTDRQLEQHHGRPVRELYRAWGDALFRQHEQALLASLHNVQRSVIAVGGGAPLHPPNQPLLRRLGTIVHLYTPFQEIVRRIEQQGLPAFVSPASPWDDLRQKYEERLPLYRSLAHYELDLNRKNTEQALYQLREIMIDLREP
jgi:shikimate kinase